LQFWHLIFGVYAMKKKFRILLIDDNQEIIAGLLIFLGGKGYDVVTASDGLEGMKIIEADRKGFDLVITDVVMPYVSGVGIIAVIKQKRPQTPVIAITGMGEHPEKLAREASADVVLVKPFDLKDLKKHIEDLLSKQANHRSQRNDT
jgi:DNA-binding response OmpR family regulator